ncbi:hypothetical protein [Nonomuraea fuscirosea]|uniref:hypothetical protein n=1 Tax=Nonomuraea fuscirosea TaxID=1291556 RepID=UPI0033F9D0FF
MTDKLLPSAGATEDAPCPQTILTSNHPHTLTATDPTTGDSTTLTPARLYLYRHTRQTTSDEEPPPFAGLAALDADDLILLDLPGEWHIEQLKEFARKAEIPLQDARNHTSRETRIALAARAPGWRRMHGLPSPAPTPRWRKPVAICAGIAGAALMIYLAMSGLWLAWRGLSTFGRIILDLVDGKWLLVAFSPVLLLLRPLRAKFHRYQVKRGLALGPYTGLHLILGAANKLQVRTGNAVIAEFRLGELHGQAFSLLLYRHENLTGLLIRDRYDRPLHHLPGPWSPHHAEHFARRHDLALAIHQIDRDEYTTLTKRTREATP